MVNIDVHIIQTLSSLFFGHSFSPETKQLNANAIFPPKRYTMHSWVNMWTSGHMISMKNCNETHTHARRTHKKMWSNNKPCCEYFPSYIASLSVCLLQFLLYLHWNWTTQCLHRRAFVRHIFFSAHSHTTLSALNGYATEIEMNGFVGDYDIS